MRVFLAGGSGAVGSRLVSLLAAAGHHVTASTRTSAKVAGLRAAGAEPVILDLLDRGAVTTAVTIARPDVIIHQATALAAVHGLKDFDREFSVTNALRTEGTEYLIGAARAAGTKRFVAQSYAGWPTVREGGRVKSEDDPLDAHPPRTMARSLEAIRRLETAVSELREITGVVLRYGSFYGPGTSIGFAPGGEPGDVLRLIQGRKLPVIGGGRGVWSFTHIEDAAAAAWLAAERGDAGIYNIVDDEPAEVSIWLPELARVIGAKPPYRVPAWLVGPMVGEAMMVMLTTARGASNAKAKRALGWEPRYATWRDGFRRSLGPETAPTS